MLSIQSILFPTDFSDAADAVRPHVLELARRYDADVHLLHVLENFVTPVDFAWTSVPTAEIDARRNQAALERLQEMAAGLEIGKGMVHFVVEHGAAYHRIVEYAEQNDIDLICMATHGRTGLNHLLVGSTAERVVRHAPCPVLTHKPASQDPV